jgi:alcohol dehydrogenase class IV
LAALTGTTRLSELGVAETDLPAIAATAATHPLLANTPEPPSEEELSRLLREAF